MPASQKLLNIARGAITIVINTRIFWKKMFDSRHIPEKKPNHMENTWPGAPNQHTWRTVHAQSSAESLVSFQPPGCSHGMWGWRAGLTFIHLPGLQFCLWGNCWAASLPASIHCSWPCSRKLSCRSPSRQAAFNLYKERTHAGSGGWWGESAVAHRCLAREIRRLLLKDKVELLIPVSLTAPWLAPLQRPFEASLWILSPLYYLRQNSEDKSYTSKIPFYVL